MVAFLGAIRDLAPNNCMHVCPLSSIRANTAAAYARPLASQNVCKVRSPVLIARDISIFFNACKSYNYCLKFSQCLSSSGVSQSFCSLHNSRNSNFGNRDTGHVKPIGPKILLAAERITLFATTSGYLIFRIS